MKYIKEQVAYLKGLADGLEVNATSPEGKVIVNMLTVLDDIADALAGLAEGQHELEDYVEMIDEDVSDIEEYVLDFNAFDDDEDYDFDDDDTYEVVCPKCGESYDVDFDAFDADEVYCPECGEKFLLEEDILDELTAHNEDGCPDSECPCCHH